jgi:aryl-alcohol dehydrogenase-like predicted oxidoreductase
MERRTIPNTSLQVSTLCLGTMTFGTPVVEADAIRLTHAALERGINFIDTANMYEGYARYIGSPGGVAEEILGKALKGKREQVILATKVGMKIGPADDDQGLSAAHIRREIDRSLHRLECEYIDLYYMHKPDPAVPLADSVSTFDELVRSGKVCAWGVSNFSAAQFADLLRVCDENGCQRPAVIQPAYSVLNRAIEADLLPLCVREHIAVIPFRVLEGGALTGKYRRGQEAPGGSRQLEKPEWTLAMTDENFARLEQAEAAAMARKLDLTGYALKALLEQLGIVSLIIGVKRIEQLDHLIAEVNAG